MMKVVLIVPAACLELQWMRMTMSTFWIHMQWNSLVQDKQERIKKSEI